MKFPLSMPPLIALVMCVGVIQIANTVRLGFQDFVLDQDAFNRLVVHSEVF